MLAIRATVVRESRLSWRHNNVGLQLVEIQFATKRQLLRGINAVTDRVCEGLTQNQDLLCGIIPKKLVQPQKAPECGADRGDFQGLRANLANPADLAFRFNDSAYPEPGFACGKASCFFSIRACIQNVPDATISAELGSDTNCYVIESYQ
jgi:hypothetical protein